MRSSLFIILLFSSLLVGMASEAAIYKVVDENGRVTYTDSPPSNNKTSFGQIETNTNIGYQSVKNNQSGDRQMSGQNSALENEAIKSFPYVKLYVRDTCEYCDQAKAFLRNNGVPFRTFDVDTNPTAAKNHKRLSPLNAVPIAVIGGEVVQGYLPDIYRQLLGL